MHPTPALVIDRARVEQNINKVASYATDHGLDYRPHVKTHKSALIGGMQISAGAIGLSCATTREAEVMRAVTDDLLVAYPPVTPDRAEAIATLAKDAQLGVMLDSSFAAEMLSTALGRHAATARVLVEVDMGMHRVGIAEVAAAVELAQQVDQMPGLNFDGFGFYPGHLRSAGTEVDADIRTMSAHVAELKQAATKAGLNCRTISSGSTPLLWRSHEFEGITEIRAGTAAYFDRTSVLGGVCSYDDCAATVLATVVSTTVQGQVVVDAGVKALGREPMRGADAAGFACVADRPAVAVTRLSEEHGVLDLTGTDWRPEVGHQVRLIPNHICVAVHNFDRMHIQDVSGEIEQHPVDARGR